MKAILWGTTKRKVVTCVVGGLLLLALIVPSPDEDSEQADATTSTTAVEMPLPERREGSTDDRPFWSTTFAVRLPAGAWEEVDGDCRALSDDVRLLTAEGADVAPYDSPPSVTLDLTNDIDGDTCLVEGSVIGDYDDDVSLVYLLQIGDAEAQYSSKDLYQGQGGGENAVVDATDAR